MIDPKIEKSAMKTKNAIMNKIISAGIEATANLIRKESESKLFKEVLETFPDAELIDANELIPL